MDRRIIQIVNEIVEADEMDVNGVMSLICFYYGKVEIETVRLVQEELARRIKINDGIFNCEK